MMKRKNILWGAVAALSLTGLLSLWWLTRPSAPPTPVLEAIATAAPAAGNAPLTVTFDGSNSKPQGAIVRYQWEFESGQITNEATVKVVHTYQRAGEYTATLTVQASDGSTDRVTLRISVQDRPKSADHISNPSHSIVLGDYDEDGHLDLVLAHFIDDQLLLSLGDGAGNFTALTPSLPAKSGPRSLVGGDFNLDRHLDLAVVNLGSGDVTVLLGDGTGGFSEAQGSPVPVGVNPVPIASADFNEDGYPDLAVANGLADTVTILLGSESGFKTAPTPPLVVGNGPRSLAFGDFDQDGHLDLVIASRFVSNVTVLLGDGHGDFSKAPGSPFSTDKDPRSLAVADFDQDGLVDLAVANAGDGTVTVFTGTGRGRFRRNDRAYRVGKAPVSITIGDLDHDGHLDLAVADAVSGDIFILLGDGRGDFAVGNVIAAGKEPRALTLEDLNDDGHLDLVVANRFVNTVVVLLGDGQGAFAEVAASPFAAGSGPRSLAAGDFDGDGRVDFAITQAGKAAVSIVLAAADTRFIPVSSTALALTTGDFDGDGKTDLALADRAQDRVKLLLGDGQGSFIEVDQPGFRVGSNPVALASGDLNEDGLADLVVVNGLADTVTVLLGRADERFDEALGSPLAVGAGPRSVALGDFNSDGHLDLAVASRFINQVSIYLGEGTGRFSEAELSIFFYLNPGAPAVAAGDFNGDGHADLAVVSLDRSLTVLLGDGAVGFEVSAESPLQLDVIPTAIATADVDGDGILDLVVVDGVVDTMTVFTGDGEGGFDLSVF